MDLDEGKKRQNQYWRDGETSINDKERNVFQLGREYVSLITVIPEKLLNVLSMRVLLILNICERRAIVRGVL